MTTEKPKISVEKITEIALVIAKKCLSKKPESIVGIFQKEGEWIVTVEALERKAVPDSQDLLARYEIRLNKNGELIGWAQKMIRKRCDRILPPEEEWVITG
jgi:hypothetical protein